MGALAMNPGAGPVKTGSWEQAYENIKQFIKDCEIPLHIVSAEFTPDDGRYLFCLAADNFEYRTEIEMPGLPLENVRYMSDGEQNPFDFPRLYVDGSSWLWKFALVTKEYIREYVDDKVSDLEMEIKKMQDELSKI